MSTNLDLNRTGFQTAVRSSPVDENWVDIENGVNDLQTQIDGINTPASGSEVSNARDYHPSLRNRLRSASTGQGNIIITGGETTEQGTPDMTVAVAAGEAIVSGVACDWTAQNSGTITAPTTNPRYDVVVINSDNSLSIVQGSEAASPVYPSIASTQRPLAILTLVVSQTSITTSDIDDWRFGGSYSRVTGEWSYSAGTIKREIFTEDGTWYRPTHVDYAKVIIVGAGGDGEDGTVDIGGGGAGGQIREIYVPVTGNISVTVGAAPSNNSSFGSYVATGGGSASGTSGGTGGTGGGNGGVRGDDYYGENNGSNALYGENGLINNGGGTSSGSFSTGGGGGCGYNGKGGNGGTNTGAGINGGDGEGWGAGGGGGSHSPDVGNGGLGIQGVVIVEWIE